MLQSNGMGWVFFKKNRLGNWLDFRSRAELDLGFCKSWNRFGLGLERVGFGSVD